MTTPIDDWKAIHPQVAAEAEFFEILNDFGDPLELLREGLSNAIDAGATECNISFVVADIEGARRLVIDIEDNGAGMTEEVLIRDFWGLGYSQSRSRAGAIGEKGHGTKIYLRSQRVEVRTQSAAGSFESICDNPLAALAARRLHEPRMRAIPVFREGSGTHVRIIGYNDNERSRFRQDIVKDYLMWFTKLGSIEGQVGIDVNAGFKVTLRGLDVQEPEQIKFGHVFPPENNQIQKLFQELGPRAADYYVKRFTWKGERLPNHPEVAFDVVISVEGDEAKRSYNHMLRDRRRADTGKYRVSDRYGLWLCKDYIPIERVNDWITGFGSGSNAFVMLHGFVNCQDLKLTANRKSIANTDPRLLEDLRSALHSFIGDIDELLQKQGLYTLRTWQDEERTSQQERSEFERRVRAIGTRRSAVLDGRCLLEPSNESELFGLFVTLATLRPKLFPFEALDYNTTRGVDLVARNAGSLPINDGEHWYVELKHILQTQFNHSFKHLRYIVCWDFDRRITHGTEFRGIGEDTRCLAVSDDQGKPLYFLDAPNSRVKIQVIRLRQYLADELGISFEPLPPSAR